MSNQQGDNGSSSEQTFRGADLADDECPVCFDHMESPRTLPCGHNVCLTCFDMWANLSNNCPFCKRPMEDLQTVLTRTLKNLQDHLQSSIDSLNKLKTIRSHISDDPRTGIISRQISKLSDLATEVGIRVDDPLNADVATIHVMPDSNLNELMSMMFANFGTTSSLTQPHPAVPPVAPAAEPATRAPPATMSTTAAAPQAHTTPQNTPPQPTQPFSGIPGFPADIFNALQMPNLLGVPQFDTTTTIRRQFHIRSPQRGSENTAQTQPQTQQNGNTMNGGGLDSLFSSLSSLLQQSGTPNAPPNAPGESQSQ